LGIPIVLVAALSIGSGTASATTWTGSESFNVNPTAASFNPQPQLPPLSMIVSYDDSGTITLTESGGNLPAEISTFEQNSGFAPDWTLFPSWEFDHIDLAASSGVDITISGLNGALTDSNVSGYLAPQVTPSADGSSLTASFTNPQLADQNLSYVTITGTEFFTGPSSEYSYDYAGGSFYFPGRAPTVAVTRPGAQRSLAGFAATSLYIRGALRGVARGDDNARITTLSASGLPPGLHLGSNAKIVGTPTQPGSYQVILHAAGRFNDGTQTASGSVTFPWTVVAPAAKLPIWLGAPYRGKGLQIRPTVITYTGDGTGFFAGYGAPGHRPHIGTLHWTTWTTERATATGGDWIDNCTPDCATGWRTAYRVSLIADQPEVFHGYSVFTRLTVTYTHGRPPLEHRGVYVDDLYYGNGGFFWNQAGFKVVGGLPV
jgi:hypothetical protein